MKAIVLTQYGSPDGLHLRELDKPTPRDDDVLIRVRASSVSAGDCEIRTLKFPLFIALPIRLMMGVVNPRNKILGQELAGDVEAVGKNVTRFKAGDAVFGTTGLAFGAHAEYVRLSIKPGDAALVHKPAIMSYDEAAVLPVGGLESLHFLRKANLQRGETLLINGAGGSIGTFAVQLAKHYGLAVTAVDSTAKLDMLRSIGADHVIDYTREDFTLNGQRYDAIFDVVGKTHFERSIEALNPGGRYMIANPKLGQMVRAPGISRRTGKQIIIGSAEQTTEALLTLKELIEKGILKSVIDRRYPLEQTAEAHRYVEAGHKQGGVVITVSQP
jgi:NADPH:quinone reductase-like Zn-dependent oxidoreductase